MLDTIEDRRRVRPSGEFPLVSKWDDNRSQENRTYQCIKHTELAIS